MFRGATLSLNYIIANGEHQFHTANLNSPVNGVYPIPPCPPPTR